MPLLHGADYNPEQWLDRPEVIDEDIRLMNLARCNVVSLGIFSWAMLEKDEGVFDFGWMDNVIDKLWANGIQVILATPSGARPAWLSKKYPEVLRVQSDRVRLLHGERHNHCYTSPVYRAKTHEINEQLARRYKDHPAVILWHISNEYSGECHCELCQTAFRKWLKEKYIDLDTLNRQWWTGFWSHTYTSWEQIESPAPHGERSVHGLMLDWKRFVTYQTVDFMKNEIEPLKRLTNIPVTTNFMYAFEPLDYFKFTDVVDVVSWDSYPNWHKETNNIKAATGAAFNHDLMRSIKSKPFLLMESTPSITNWKTVNKLKRPGMHMLSSMQAIAHGSDSVQYFQWRKSRGSFEKFHGAVMGHRGGENTRVFSDVTRVGEALAQMDAIVGTSPKAEVAIVLDWENWWGINEMRGFRMDRKDYFETCRRHYEAFWKRGIPVDIIDSDGDFSKYKLIAAPMLYMMKEKTAEKIADFVEKGGVWTATYLTGQVNESDLCFLDGDAPARILTEVLGVWPEDLDALYDTDINYINTSWLPQKEYEVKELCELIHTTTAEVLGSYKQDFYAGNPAFTVNRYGDGAAYYIACRDCGEFIDDFYEMLVREHGIAGIIDAKLPEGVTVSARYSDTTQYIFIQNYADTPTEVCLGDRDFKDFFTGSAIKGRVSLDAFGLMILTGEKTR